MIRADSKDGRTKYDPILFRKDCMRLNLHLNRICAVYYKSVNKENLFIVETILG